MRRLALALLIAALTAGAIASCRDASIPTESAPSLSPPLLSKSGKVSVCHAAGQASNPKFVELSISDNALGAHLDEHGTPQAGHEKDYLVTNRTPCPPPATPGVLRVCKVGAPGIPAGTLFSFLIAGEAVSIPSGQCVSRPFRVGTRVDVKETVPANLLLSGLTLTPIEAGTTDLASAAANVIVGTDLATLTYTNHLTATLVICKIAGYGVTVGTPANFSVTGVASTITVASGAAPTGTCAAPVQVPDGAIFVTETYPPGITVAGQPGTNPIFALTGGTSSSTFHTANLTVVAGQTTTITFTNIKTLLVICKSAGDGVAVGTEASFSITGIATPVTVAAGATSAGNCSAPISVPPGLLSVTETYASGTYVIGQPATNPISALKSSSSNATSFTANLDVLPGQTTTVTFRNVASSLVICKVAGSGVAVGTQASFNVTAITTPIVIAAGAGPDGNCAAPIPMPPGPISVTEMYAPGTYVSGPPVTIPVSALKSSSSTNFSFTANLEIAPAMVTTVIFRNVASFLVICKIAGNGVAVGTEATFSVPGVATPITIAAGAGPTGNCATPIPLPPGTVAVTETYAAGTHVAGPPSTNPVAAFLGGSAGATSATFNVAISNGAVTTVTFTNVSNPP